MFSNMKSCIFADWKNSLIMSAEMMSNMLAEYFKTKPILKAWLFGSFARGEETSQSDVDILIVLDHTQTVGMDFFGMYEELKDLLGRNVDLVTERSLAPFARKSVEQDRKLVYERINTCLALMERHGS